MTIAEVSKRYGLSADTLHYYERIGLILPINRMNSGIRDYTEEDCRWVEFAKCMRSAGLQIEALIEYVTLFQQGDRTRECRKQLLVEQRDKLQIQIKEMQQTMERLDKKIARYEQGHGADGKRTQTVKKRGRCGGAPASFAAENLHKTEAVFRPPGVVYLCRENRKREALYGICTTRDAPPERAGISRLCGGGGQVGGYLAGGNLCAKWRE